jgi:glucose-1-phosphate adenylyltransferase
MKDVITVVMAGGMGERLKPLTQVRAKPAVPFGGVFRIIDFTLSNCINSGLRRVYVLTQYKSHSLSNHLKTGWSFLPRRMDDFVEEIPAQMQIGEQWYKGTADAIRQNMSLLVEKRPQQVLILSGDHIYKMDYRVMKKFHQEKMACLTIGAVRIHRDEARGQYGVIEVDDSGRVVGFEEKPDEPKVVPGTDQCLASMGIYIFNYECLEMNLENDLTDFGRDIIPTMIQEGQEIYAFDFTRDNSLEEYEYITLEGQRIKTRVARASDSDYWRDVGTIVSFWLANLDLVAPKPLFNLYSELWPLYINPQHFPPAKFVHETEGRTGMAVNSVISDGVIVSGSVVRSSVLSPGIYIHSYSTVESSVLMGGTLTAGEVNETQIGRHCRIRNAIIDKNVKISAGTALGYNREEDEKRGLTVSEIRGTDDYVVTVPKDFSL